MTERAGQTAAGGGTVATEFVLPGLVEPDGLQRRTRTLAAPGDGQAIVRVEATGVSFAEQQMRRGKYYDQPPFPFVPGYDLVGTVEAAADPALVGRRVAALTKTGAWADRVLLEARDLVPVPDGVGAEPAEAVVVNGVTAWRMLHTEAKVRAGDTIVVLGAAGGVGSLLVQLARAAGVRVIGTASGRRVADVEALGAIALDRRGEDVPARVRELAPDGVAAVFDHVGGPGIVDSWRMLAPGGALIAYGSASTKDETGSSRLPILKLFARLLTWNLLPNRRRARFFDLWAGVRDRDRYAARLREDLGAVLDLVARGELTPPIARVFALDDAPAALRYAESGDAGAGKVLLTSRP